jgi:hypothetical protein
MKPKTADTWFRRHLQQSQRHDLLRNAFDAGHQFASGRSLRAFPLLLLRHQLEPGGQAAGNAHVEPQSVGAGFMSRAPPSGVAISKKARRRKIPAAGPGSLSRLQVPLEHAEHDGADKGEGDVGGHYAQTADVRTKCHCYSPWDRVDARSVGLKLAMLEAPKKSAWLSIHLISAAHNRSTRG